MPRSTATSASSQSKPPARSERATQPPLVAGASSGEDTAGVGAMGLPASLLSPAQLQSVVESLLFVAGRPLDLLELRRLLLVEESLLREAVSALAVACEREGRGVRVQRLGTTVQFVSAPENARFVAALLGLPTQVKLTTAALETLAVVAYRQPITRSQIEFIRGVNSDRALSSLIQHGLVSEMGRAATVGRPTLFGTTPEFLQQFGLTSLEALPAPEVPEADAAEALRLAAAKRIRETVGVDDVAHDGASDR